MKRIHLKEIMTDETMAILLDEDNAFVYDVNAIPMYGGDLQEKILITNVKMKLKAEKEDMSTEVLRLIQFLEAMNLAFNRSVGASRMKLFKVLEKKASYAGNQTVMVELKLATLATGMGSAIHAFLNPCGMNLNIWGTNANIYETTESMASETYGLGNALRSWRVVLRKYAKTSLPLVMPAILFQYVD